MSGTINTKGKNIMTGKQFRYLRYEILKKQGKKLKYQDLEVRELEFEKKIAEKDNIEKFAEIVENNRGKELLMIAGTGTGKTYTVNKYMDELYAKEKGQHRIELIGVPSTAQARQLQKEGFHVLVEDNSISDMDFLCKSYFRSKATGHSSMKIVFVYDKAETVRKFLKRHKNYQADLFVDEAHKLYTAYNYRKDALDIVELLIHEVKDRNGSVVLMTATPKALAFRESIGQVLYCKGAERVAQYQQIEIVCKEKKADSFQDVVYSTIRKEVESGNHCFVRYNSFIDTGDISAKLRAVDNMNVKVVSSKNKDFEIETDSEGNRYNLYKNDIFNCFVNKSSLPEADCWFTTSMLDEGGSIERIEKHGQPENLVAIFVVKDKRFMQIDDAMQFSARIRFPYKKFVFIINREIDAESEKISEMENLTWGITQQVNLTKSIVEQYAEIIRLKKVGNEEFEKELKNFTQLENVAGFQNNMDCITIDSDCRIGADEKKKALLIYNTFNNQYIDNIPEFVEHLKKVCDCREIQVIQAKVVKADFDINQYLLPVMGDSNLLLQIYDDYVEDDMLKTITHTKEYKKIQRLIQIQDVIRGAEESKVTKARKAIESVCLGEKTAAEFKKELLGELLKKVPDSEIKEMYQEKYYKGSLVKEKEVLEQEELMDMLHRLHTLLENLDEAVQKLKQSGGNVEEVKKYIRNNFDGYMNEMYLADREKLWGMDKVGRERTIILDNIYELNSSGNLKKKTINEKLLEQVVTALNEEFGAGAYTNTKVKNRIKKMFKLQDNGTKIYDVVRIIR